MILDPVDNNQPSKKEQEALQERVKAQEEHLPDDLPPEYTSLPENGAGPAGGAPNNFSPMAMTEPGLTSYSRLTLPDLKPSNFVHLSRNNSSVKGVWIIDPSLFIPAAFLPALPSGQTEESRENLYLQTKNGVVDAEVYLLPIQRTTVCAAQDDPTNSAVVDAKSTAAHRPQAIFRARSSNGSVTMKIHDVPPEHPTTTGRSTVSEGEEKSRPPLQVDCLSSNGSIYIYIPRSFHGPLSISTRNGSVHFSDAIKPLLTHFSEVNGAQRSFLGHFADAHKWQNGLQAPTGEWVGDMLKAESMNGSVRISFEDEIRSTPVSTPSRANNKSQAGFFGRIFGSF